MLSRRMRTENKTEDASTLDEVHLRWFERNDRLSFMPKQGPLRGSRFPRLHALATFDLVSQFRKSKVNLFDLKLVLRRVGVRQILLVSVEGLWIFFKIVVRGCNVKSTWRQFPAWRRPPIPIPATLRDNPSAHEARALGSRDLHSRPALSRSRCARWEQPRQSVATGSGAAA